MSPAAGSGAPHPPPAIPWSHAVRPDTGFSNAQLGTWLLIASETMLFAGLLAGHVLLRLAATAPPAGRPSLPLGLAAALLLLAASAAAAAARRAATTRPPAVRRRLAAGTALGLAALAIATLDARALLAAGLAPRTDNFLAAYFTLSGVHALHLAAGVVALLYLAGPGAALARREPARHVARVEATALYQHFVTAVGLVLFAAFHLWR